MNQEERSTLSVSRRVTALAAVAVLCGALAPHGASANGAGSFTPTGPMGQIRVAAAAAPLLDGRVLVTGGYNNFVNTGVSSAEVFDPETNTFTATSSMRSARQGHIAAPLPDGRVLVAGGLNVSGPLGTAEVFNPATNTWSPVGSMGTARVRAAAAPLPDGRVLVVGGTSDLYDHLASAELFNPATNSFSSAGIGSMSTTRSEAVAAPLPGGRVLIAGGYNGFGHLANAEVFHPAHNFTTAGIGSMSTLRFGAAAAPLPGGRVLVAGGDDGSYPIAGAEIFDSATNSFGSAGTGSMGTARHGAAAAPLPGGRVLVAGGSSGDWLQTAEIYAADTTPAAAPVSNAFTFTVKGKRLLVDVQASGNVTVTDAVSRATASAPKGEPRRLLRSSSAMGGPPTIEVPLMLTKLAKVRLKRKGKVAVNARITFTPRGGPASTKIAKLRLKVARRK